MAKPLPSFCLHRIMSGGGSAAAPPSIHAKEESSAGDDGHSGGEHEVKDDVKDEKPETMKAGKNEAAVVGRKVMVAADGGSEEARTALQWALSHAVRPCDTLVLLDVVRGGSGKNRGDPNPRSCQQLEAMRTICQAKRPEVRVELFLVEGKDRGPVIVEAARKQGVSLLVVGQKKRSVTWWLLSMWMAGMKGAAAWAGTGAADYCVQNAACMALAVRRKSRRGGGYLITTRRQRDFWLLA